MSSYIVSSSAKPKYTRVRCQMLPLDMRGV